MAIKEDHIIHVTIIGSGNISWHLVSHLSFYKRFKISVYNRSKTKRLIQLEKEFKVDVFSDWKKINLDSDIIFICTPDQHISDISKKLSKLHLKGMVLHCSGTTSIHELEAASKKIGVFYPLQSFTFGQSVNWQEVPIFIETIDKKSLSYLASLARLFSKTVIKANHDKRLKLHLAAVIAGNFSNAMYASAYTYISKELNPSNFKYLIPLINATARKVIFGNPALVQTGPAVRKDKKTLQLHQDLLKKHHDLKKTYKAISKLIQKQNK